MKNFSDIFFVPSHDADIRPGSLLVAEPFMRDRWFGRSVVLMLHHNDGEGSDGVVLNNPLQTPLSDILSDVTAEGVTVYCGGPVGHDQLIYIHTLGEHILPGCRKIADGLWLGGDFEATKEYVNSGYPIDGHIRFIIGYSGWSKGQLDDEIRRNSWAVANKKLAPGELLTGTGDKYWHKIVRDLGDKYRPWRMLPGDWRAN